MNSKLAIIYKLIIGGLALVAVSVLFVYLSFLLPGKFNTADWIRIGLTEHVIESIEKIENAEYKSPVDYQEQQNSTLTFADLEPYLTKIRPGTVFVISHGKVVCNIIPGKWTHVGFYIGTQKQLGHLFGEESSVYQIFRNYYSTGEEHLIIDSSYKNGCAVRDFKEIAQLKSRSTLHSVLCLEPKLSVNQLSKILQTTLAETGKKYDLNFSVADTSTLYCAELIYNSFKYSGIEIKKRSSVLFRKILLPNDIATELVAKQMDKYFEYKMCLIKNKNKVQDMACIKEPGLIAGL
ncbi:YiiX/YebB-like N1pC/P60 family cysteine hydrolase [uncultured Draconibacterium sp.]|uniref:YiiX/YebB-like N1pC/P60 family cysteine hydrolase n=1 Tax=uncultured Draconibacterium sp. TaxID=1573823 RepID=UPI0032169002